MREFVDSNALLARAVAYLNEMTPRPDVVLATGDLTDHGTAAEYGLLPDILGALEVPLFLVHGNHDDVDVRALVSLHHPPFETGIWWMDCIGLTGARELETVVRRHPQVRLVGPMVKGSSPVG